MVWYLYVLACGDGSLYTGITNDLVRRVGEHQAGRGGRYTRAHLPVEPVAAWAFPDRSEATSAEAAFKRLRRDAKLERVRGRLPFSGAVFAKRTLSAVVDCGRNGLTDEGRRQ
jgi:putative endonuclease